MYQNANTMSHPETIRKMRAALWIARMDAHKKAKARKAAGGIPCGEYIAEGRQYVANRKGQLYLRVSVFAGHDGTKAVRVYGDQGRDITALVLQHCRTK